MSAISQNQALMAEFVSEALEHIAAAEEQLLAIETSRAQATPQQINIVFRAIHSLKGAAGFLELNVVKRLAHALEDVLNQVRNGRLLPTAAVINASLRAVDQLKLILNQIDNEATFVVDREMEDLRRAAAGEERLTCEIQEPLVVFESEPSAPPVPPKPNTKSETAEKSTTPAYTTPPVEYSVPSVTREAIRDFLVESHENLDQIERDIQALEQNPAEGKVIRGMFRNIHTLKGAAGFFGFNQLENIAHTSESVLGAIRCGEIHWTSEIGSVLISTIDMIRELLNRIETFGSDHDAETGEMMAKLLLVQVQDQSTTAEGSVPPSSSVAAAPVTMPSTTANRDSSNSCQREPAASTVTELHAAQTDNDEATVTPTSTSNLVNSTLRVDVGLLDKLMNCVGELVLARNQILQLTSMLHDPTLVSASQRLNLITTELQEGVMKTRMQPIGTAWNKFPRFVRDLALQCGKRVQLELTGRETELDKTILEAIKDPLTHLVRNCIDHGLETEAERIAAGKSAEGNLCLRACHEGGQVNIEVADDGRGLNYERIREKAVERGLLSASQVEKLSDHETAQLIFLPSFSTTDKVTQLSGRGVGMDVVKTNIEKIGGAVEITSQPGCGTTFKIKIPLTLAIVPALIVTTDGDRFAIPQVNLLELVRIDATDVARSIEFVHDVPVYRLRGKMLPLVSLRQVLALKSGDEWQQGSSLTSALNIVVLKADDMQFGLLVDAVNDTEEIVVKPLSKHLKHLTVYAGATVRGDGQVVLILDVLGLARQAHVLSDKSHTKTRVDSPHNIAEQFVEPNFTMLVVKLSGNRRAALPISQVSRVEEIDVTQASWADGQHVIRYRDTVLTLVELAEQLDGPVDEATQNGLRRVLVFPSDNHYVGLMVHEIIDVLNTPVRIVQPSRRRGVAGAAVLGNMITEVLDVPYLVRHAAVANNLAVC